MRSSTDAHAHAHTHTHTHTHTHAHTTTHTHTHTYTQTHTSTHTIGAEKHEWEVTNQFEILMPVTVRPSTHTLTSMLQMAGCLQHVGWAWNI
jgi:hypothetical protein